MKATRFACKPLFLSIALGLTTSPVGAMRSEPALLSGALYMQESGIAASLGNLYVAPEVMAPLLVTMVSPTYPYPCGGSCNPSTVMVRAVIWKSGRVSPLRAVSGETALENQAMDTVRLWRYRPFVRYGVAMDVSTDIRVDFDPHAPGGIVTHPSRGAATHP